MCSATSNYRYLRQRGNAFWFFSALKVSWSKLAFRPSAPSEGQPFDYGSWMIQSCGNVGGFLFNDVCQGERFCRLGSSLSKLVRPEGENHALGSKYEPMWMPARDLKYLVAEFKFLALSKIWNAIMLCSECKFLIISCFFGHDAFFDYFDLLYSITIRCYIHKQIN
jgi:hypothetical protein